MRYTIDKQAMVNYNPIMSEKVCAKCGKQVFVTDNGIVHDGGGIYEQRCRNCGWSGGQIGNYQRCPRCGDQTSLISDHVAS